MKSAATDPSLSLAAKGLFAFFLEIGRVASVDEMSAAHPESKYAMTKAMKELKDAHYIKAVRFQQNAGQWNTILKFSDPKLNLYVPETDTRNSSLLSSVSTNRHMSSDIDIDTVTNVTVSIGAAPLKETGGVQMSWPTLDEETPKPKKKFVLETDDDSGSVGKVEDTRAKINSKYKVTKVERDGRNRADYPEEDWTTGDLVAEFYDLYRPLSNGAPNQINGKHLATWINARVSDGVPRTSVLKGMRMFFADKRVTMDPGTGRPMYQRFMAYYGTVHGAASRIDKPIATDEALLEHQKKMLDLLEG